MKNLILSALAISTLTLSLPTFAHADKRGRGPNFPRHRPYPRPGIGVYPGFGPYGSYSGYPFYSGYGLYPGYGGYAPGIGFDGTLGPAYGAYGFNRGYGLGYPGLDPVQAQFFYRLEDTAKAIQKALRSDETLRPYKLGTDTVGSRIELEGRVSSDAERKLAIEIAHEIAGKTTVNASRLEVG